MAAGGHIGQADWGLRTGREEDREAGTAGETDRSSRTGGEAVGSSRTEGETVRSNQTGEAVDLAGQGEAVGPSRFQAVGRRETVRNGRVKRLTGQGGRRADGQVKIKETRQAERRPNRQTDIQTGKQPWEGAGRGGRRDRMENRIPERPPCCSTLSAAAREPAGTDEEGAVDRDGAGPASDDWSATPGCTGMQGH